MNAVAATYALAHDPAHAALATSHSELVGRPVNRFTALFRERDEMLNGAMTDPKGDRSKRPPEQPDHYVRVVARRADGVVIRGAKIHKTGAANAHQILVMQGQALREGEEEFAIVCAMPVDAPGVTMVLGRQPSDERRGGPDAGNARFGGQECVVVFEHV